VKVSYVVVPPRNHHQLSVFQHRLVSAPVTRCNICRRCSSDDDAIYNWKNPRTSTSNAKTCRAIVTVHHRDPVYRRDPAEQEWFSKC
jgi:hypothetical protein